VREGGRERERLRERARERERGRETHASTPSSVITFGAMSVWRRESAEGMSGGIRSLPPSHRVLRRNTAYRYLAHARCAWYLLEPQTRPNARGGNEERDEAHRWTRGSAMRTHAPARTQAHTQVHAHVRTHRHVCMLFLRGLQCRALDLRHGALRTGIQRPQAWRCRLAWA
jgi:hypothetical protein